MMKHGGEKKREESMKRGGNGNEFRLGEGVWSVFIVSDDGCLLSSS